MNPITVQAAISLLIALIDNLQTISKIISARQAAGDSHLSDTDWSAILDADNNARAALLAAVGGGPSGSTPPANPPPAPPGAPPIGAPA